MKRLLLFVLLNFGALALGSWLMGSPVENTWYQQINKAPWTPPGWVFGAAWFSIMALFSWYLYRNFSTKTRSWFFIYGLHLMLNISWNPVFFQLHHMLFALILIVALLFTVVWFFLKGKSNLDKWLMLPYLLWLVIATSLNAYCWLMN